MRNGNKVFTEVEMAKMRHDLKIPLSTIQGYAELLLTKLVDEKHTRWVKEILSQSKRLNEVLDEKLK